MNNTQASLFPLGLIVATPGALGAAAEKQIELAALIRRHATGDFGDLDEHDLAMNTAALTTGDRIMSVYEISGARLYVITEADRSATTVLLPEEY